MTGKLLYRVVGHNGGLVFATEARARWVARIHHAINSSKTWADFRRAMPRQAYSELLRFYDEQGEPRPKGTDDFTGEMLPGWSDGDYPPWLQCEMSELIPQAILERFGRKESTFLNGSFWWIPPEAADAICSRLSMEGFETEHAPTLPFH
jgi:hypothetical protein